MNFSTSDGWIEFLTPGYRSSPSLSKNQILDQKKNPISFVQPSIQILSKDGLGWQEWIPALTKFKSLGPAQGTQTKWQTVSSQTASFPSPPNTTAFLIARICFIRCWPPRSIHGRRPTAALPWRTNVQMVIISHFCATSPPSLPFSEYIHSHMHCLVRQRLSLSSWRMELLSSSSSPPPFSQFHLRILRWTQRRCSETTATGSLLELDRHCKFPTVFFKIHRFLIFKLIFYWFHNFETLKHGPLCCGRSRGSSATKKVERYSVQKVTGDGRCLFRALVFENCTSNFCSDLKTSELSSVSVSVSLCLTVSNLNQVKGMAFNKGFSLSPREEKNDAGMLGLHKCSYLSMWISIMFNWLKSWKAWLYFFHSMISNSECIYKFVAWVTFC